MFPPLISLLFLLLLLLLHSTPLSATHLRRILHHPLTLSTTLLPPSPSPLHHSPSPPPSSSPVDDTGLPFFPNYPPPPLPPTPSTTAIPTFPANVSSLALPTSPTSHSHPSNKLIILLVLVPLIALVSFIVFIVILRRNTRRKSSELKPLYPHDAPTSDGKPPPTTHHVSHTSSDFLYLGTVTETSEFQVRPTLPVEGTATPASFPNEQVVYHLKLCGTSPELKPLPPLPKLSGSFHLTRSSEHHFQVEEEGGVSETTSTRGEKFLHPDNNPDNNQEFFSPTNSSRQEDDYFNNSGLKSCFSSSSYHGSPCRNSESQSQSPGRDSDVSVEIQALAEKAQFFPAPTPPPPPPPQTAGAGPPQLVPPSGPVVMKRSGNLSKSGERMEEGGGNGMKPKLKALYWDKVRASSDRVTVWDQLYPGSFKVNEEMIETLFTANGAKDGARRSILPSLNEEYRVLDPKKSQNIAILLKALSVTEKEVCEALSEGNADTLGTELLECLLKMAPTKDEERKLLDYNDETPMKLGPAEKFLRAVLDVPFAFKRVDAMLYMATFDSEVEYLTKAFETLEAACEQLRNSRMFLKLIEAVLKTGNRMNIGTNRGDAHAFKLDTLLKLIDIKGRDGKTTLLHFVVQEIIKAEGSRNHSQTSLDSKSGSHIQPAIPDDVESRKRGLEVVGSLGGELMNVKKSAAMDSDALSTDIAKLTRDINKINEVLRLNKGNQMTDNKRFEEAVNGFLKMAEMEIVRVQSQQSNAFTKVKELTEYFHGNLSKEEAHPFRIFTVVRDFLGVLDQVCKEVGKINERTIMSSVRQPPASVNSTQQTPFPEFRIADVDENESVI